jgi:tungstate transport system ATP-binding protein
MPLIAATAEQLAGRNRGVATANPLMPLRVRGLCFTAGQKTLLDGVSFEIRHGARTVILGPNGAGKSVLLRIIHGLLRPSAGEISWGGATPEQARRHQGMVFQRTVMLRRSALGNVLHALKVRGVPRARRSALAEEALRAAGLEARARQSARTLSGGEQQRLAIARAWALRPDVLLLDEPTSNLDPEATALVEQLIRAVEADGARIIMTTHDIGQARRLADQVIFLHHGRLLEHSPAKSFFAGPANPAAARFISGGLLA